MYCITLPISSTVWFAPAAICTTGCIKDSINLGVSWSSTERPWPNWPKSLLTVWKQKRREEKRRYIKVSTIRRRTKNNKNSNNKNTNPKNSNNKNGQVQFFFLPLNEFCLLLDNNVNIGNNNTSNYNNSLSLLEPVPPQIVKWATAESLHQLAVIPSLWTTTAFLLDSGDSNNSNINNKNKIDRTTSIQQRILRLCIDTVRTYSEQHQQTKEANNKSNDLIDSITVTRVLSILDTDHTFETAISFPAFISQLLIQLVNLLHTERTNCELRWLAIR